MPIRIVLVDDVREVRQLVRLGLRRRGGFRIIGEASTGEMAVAQVAATQPDLVLLDLGLPDIAGRDVLTRIRQTSPATKVVVFTGTYTGDRSWMREQADGFALKGGDLSYLLDLLTSFETRRDSYIITRLERDPSKVKDARAFVRSYLDRWGFTGLADDAVVILSELVTNAMTHALSACDVRVVAGGAWVRVEVRDNGRGTPDPIAATPELEHGRGLHIVGALSSSWGVEHLPNGSKTVWAELTKPSIRA